MIGPTLSPQQAPRRRTIARGGLSVCLGAALFLAAGCGSQPAPDRSDGVLDIVATTPIVADLARNVAGDHARVTGLMPSSADPHTYELSLRDVRNVANADIAFTNGLLLEPQALLRAVDSGVREGVEVVELADAATGEGGELIPLVENLSLDTVWLGVRIKGLGKDRGGSKASEAQVTITGVRGPGDAAAFVIGTFGKPEILFNSADGFQPERGYDGDQATLPVDAHTHMSWAFSEPGIYEVDFASALIPQRGDRPLPIATNTVTFAVGVNPEVKPDTLVINEGHHDVAIDVDRNIITIDGDLARDGADPATTVVTVPPKTLQQIPAGPDFRFLGKPGSETYLLPQAVLGKHVHGEIDPHVWHNVANAIAMVKIIRNHLVKVDPQSAKDYYANADAYISRLSDLDTYMRERLGTIPQDRRHLITAHDGYAYLAKAYGLDVAGFVTPNPAIEPSSRDMVALTRTLQNLAVPAVFIEPSLAGRAGDLKVTAERLGVDVCTIRGDNFDPEISSYIELMEANAQSLERCLGTHPSHPHERNVP